MAADGEAAAARTPRAPLLAAGALLGFLVLAVLLTLPIWEDPLRRYATIPTTTDPIDAMWFLTWTPYALSHGLSPFVSDYRNYPLGLNLMWNTWMPAVAILAWPVTALGGATLADNVVTTVSFALAGFFAYLVIQRYTHNRFAAAVGGLIYGFSPYMVAQGSAHAQMVAAAVTIPLALLVIDEILVRQRHNRWLLGIGLASLGIFQFFVLEEYFVTELGALLLLTAILAVLHRDQVRPRFRFAASSLGLAGVITAVVLAYPVVALQLHGPDRVLSVLHDPDTYVTDPLSLVIPTSDQWLQPSWIRAVSARFTGNPVEWNGYLGVGLAAVVTVTAAIAWRRAVVRAAAIFAAAMTLLSMGPHLHVDGTVWPVPLPWWIPSRLPLLRDILPNRLMVYVYLAVAVIAATAITMVWTRSRGRLLASTLTLAVVVFLVPTVPLPWEQLSVPSYFTAGAAEVPAGVGVLTSPCACAFPTTALEWQMAPEALEWQIASGMRFKVVGGYLLGPQAPNQGFMNPFAAGLTQARVVAPLAPPYRAVLLDQLRANHIGAFVMHDVADPTVAATILSDALGLQPRLRDGVYVWILPTG